MILKVLLLTIGRRNKNTKEKSMTIEQMLGNLHAMAEKTPVIVTVKPTIKKH